MISKPGLAPVHAEGPPRRRTAEGAAVGGGRPRIAGSGGDRSCSPLARSAVWWWFVALWVSHQGVSLLPVACSVRRSRPAHRVGRVDLLLLQVLLMARIPWVDGPGGTTCWFAGTGRWASLRSWG